MPWYLIDNMDRTMVREVKDKPTEESALEILADIGWTIIWSDKERETFERIPEEDFWNGEWK